MTDRTDEPTPTPTPPNPLPEHSTPTAEPGADPDGDDPEMDRADRANGEPDADDGGPGSGG